MSDHKTAVWAQTWSRDPRMTVTFPDKNSGNTINLWWWTHNILKNCFCVLNLCHRTLGLLHNPYLEIAAGTEVWVEWTEVWVEWIYVLISHAANHMYFPATIWKAKISDLGETCLGAAIIKLMLVNPRKYSLHKPKLHRELQMWPQPGWRKQEAGSRRSVLPAHCEGRSPWAWLAFTGALAWEKRTQVLQASGTVVFPTSPSSPARTVGFVK